MKAFGMFTLLIICSGLLGGTKEELAEAKTLLLERKYAQAVAKFDAVLAKEPSNLTAKLGKIDALGFQNQKEAISTFEKSQTKGESFENEIIKAYSAIWRRDKKTADAAIGKAAAAKPDSHWVPYLKAYQLYFSPERAKAIPHLEQVIAKDPTNAEAYYMAGDLYRFQNNNQKVLEYWGKYLTMVPPRGPQYDFVKKYLGQLRGN